MKTCFKCKKEKPFNDFHKGKAKDGLHSWCKSCVSSNRVQAYRNDPESRVRHVLWTKYRLVPSDVENMLEAQDHTCLLCPQVFKERRDYHIDHDHESGKVRGLLCGSCNIRLGWFEARREEVLKYLGA